MGCGHHYMLTLKLEKFSADYTVSVSSNILFYHARLCVSASLQQQSIKDFWRLSATQSLCLNNILFPPTVSVSLSLWFQYSATEFMLAASSEQHFNDVKAQSSQCLGCGAVVIMPLPGTQIKCHAEFESWGGSNCGCEGHLECSASSGETVEPKGGDAQNFDFLL